MHSKLQKSLNFQNSTQFELCSRALKSPYKIIQVHVQFLEHNIQVSILPNTLILLSNYCFNWRPRRYTRTIYLKKIGKIYLVMAQTFDLYEIWRTTFNRFEHSLKLNRSYSYFEFILSSPQRNRISTIPQENRNFGIFGSH
jgi:hypothetical protein